MSINDSQLQLTLDLDASLTERYRNVKEAIAAGTYRRGLKRTAGDLDVAPGNLSIQLSDDGQRHFDVSLMELYIEKSGDLTPIYYLVAKYCGDTNAERDDAINRVQNMLGELTELVSKAGIAGKKARK